MKKLQFKPYKLRSASTAHLIQGASSIFCVELPRVETYSALYSRDVYGRIASGFGSVGVCLNAAIRKVDDEYAGEQHELFKRSGEVPIECLLGDRSGR